MTTKLETTLYTAVATATAGRSGSIKSEDGVLDMPLIMPKSLGGAGTPGGTNPEQLFAAGYAACFGSALGLVAQQQKVKLTPRITAHVSLGKVGENFGLAVTLEGHLPGIPKEQAEAMMKAAHEVCPYSRATRGNIEVTLKVAG